MGSGYYIMKADEGKYKMRSNIYQKQPVTEQFWPTPGQE